MTFKVNVLLDSPEDLLLQPTIRDVVWDIKAAGVYPFFIWTLGGDLLTENLKAQDSVTLTPVTTLNAFIWESSLIDGEKILW